MECQATEDLSPDPQPALFWETPQNFLSWGLWMPIRKTRFVLQSESLCLAPSSSSLQSGLGSIHTVLILSFQVFFDLCGLPGFFKYEGELGRT